MPRKIYVLPALLVIIITLFLNSCRKEAQTTTSVYAQNKGFFTRSPKLIHSDLSEGSVQSNNSNNTSTVNTIDVIDTILNLLREEDLKKRFINKIVDKYGYAQWNYSLILKNENGLKTVITPIIDSNNKVKSIILAYQLDIDKADFKIIDRKIKQTKLPYYGDKEAKVFTQVSLEGIFQSLEKKINYVNNTTSNATIKNNNDAIKSNIWQFSLDCWYYVSSGDFTITITNNQCSLSLILTPETIQNIQWDESLTQGNNSYSAPNPPSIDPVYDCNCNCTEEDPLETLASTVYEPKWGQLGTLSSIILEMNKILVSVPNYYGLNFQGKLESHKNYFEGNRFFTRDQNNNIVDAPNSKKIDRYLYTYNLGWIDMHHFFYTTYLCEKYSAIYAFYTTTQAESIQFLKNNESAYSYEDLPSNIAGITFYLLYKDEIKNGNMSLESAITKFFDDRGATSPNNAPNFDFIPHIIDGFYATNYTVRGLTGSALYNAAREAFCKKPTTRKQAIKEAHSKINHSAN